MRHGRETLLVERLVLGAARHAARAGGAERRGQDHAALGHSRQTPFAGRIIAHWAQERGRIGYVPQSFHVDRSLPVTVADFLALSGSIGPSVSASARPRRHRISRLLDRVGLAGFERRPLSVLSGGELRRVLLANALDPLPELLVLDEPAAGLDEAAARWLDDTLVSLKGDVTIVMVSHDSAQVRRVADDVTVLERARA